MSTNHDKKLSELYDLKEMYETRLKSANIDKSLKIHYQIMLDSINEKMRRGKFSENISLKDWRNQ